MSSSPPSLLTANRVLITGGCGFIGVNLTNFLIKKRVRKLRILDNLSVGKTQYLESALGSHGQAVKSSINDKRIIYTVNANKLYRTDCMNQTNQIDQRDQTHQINQVNQKIEIELIIGDIRNKETCLEATKGADYVIHLAAHAGVIPSIENPFYDFEVNVVGTLNLLHASVKNKVDRFIFASSNAPMGNQKPPMNEEKPPRPMSPYGASKLACEGYCSAFYNSYGLKTVSLRFSNAYGPYCLHKNSVIAKFIKDGLTKKVLTIYGDGTQTRDFIHVEDLCQGIYLCLNFDDGQTKGDEPNETNQRNLRNMIEQVWAESFQIGTGRETSIIDLANYIKGLFGGNIQIVFEPERKGEIRRNYSDITKAKKFLDFSPHITLGEGVSSVYEWFRSKDVDEIRKVVVVSGSE